MKFVDGSVYKGDFDYNSFHGEGSYSIPNNLFSNYTGSFQHHNISGEGELTLRSGIKYRGRFTSNSLDGIVTQILRNGKEFRCISTISFRRV